MVQEQFRNDRLAEITTRHQLEGVQRMYAKIIKAMMEKEMLIKDDFGKTRIKTIIIQYLALRDREITKKNTNAFPNQFASTEPEDIAAHEYGHWYANAEKIKRNGLEYARQAYYNIYDKEVDDEKLYNYLATNVLETTVTYGHKELTPEILAKHNSSLDVFTESFIAVINSKGV